MPDHFKCPFKDYEVIDDSQMHEAIDRILAAKLNVMILTHYHSRNKVMLILWIRKFCMSITRHFRRGE